MSFNHLSFYLAVVATLSLHRLLPWRYGRIVLLFASYAMYASAELWATLLLIPTTVVDYLVALAIHATDDPRRRKLLVGLSLVGNIGVLAAFKYSGFLATSWNTLVGPGLQVPVPHWPLPAGISFYTFQTLAYTLDVYYRRLTPERNLTSFALYVAYFPQLVAGPIERGRDLLPQLEEKRLPTREEVIAATQRILTGLVKKLVIADRLAMAVDPVYAHPVAAGPAAVVLATIVFAFQLYLDFSAYTDIAIGVARLFGVRLSENFERPFLARNCSDFWARWHMTLSRWFRDYVHAPMGGLKRGRPWRNALTTIVTMTLMGLWHGAGWNYVLFGFVSGVELAAYHALRLRRGRAIKGPLFGSTSAATVAAIALQFCQMVFTMALFRVTSIGNLLALGEAMTSAWRAPEPALLLVTIPCAVIFALEALAEVGRSPVVLRRLGAVPVLRGAAWATMILAVVYLHLDHGEAFIYFRF